MIVTDGGNDHMTIRPEITSWECVEPQMVEGEGGRRGSSPPRRPGTPSPGHHRQRKAGIAGRVALQEQVIDPALVTDGEAAKTSEGNLLTVDILAGRLRGEDAGPDEDDQVVLVG